MQQEEDGEFTEGISSSDNDNEIFGEDEHFTESVPDDLDITSSATMLLPSRGLALSSRRIGVEDHLIVSETAGEKSSGCEIHFDEELQRALDRIPAHRKMAYIEAHQKMPAVAHSESHSMPFLRHEGNDATKAAQRVVDYWEERRAIFGPDRFYLPLHQTGLGALNENDIGYLRTGVVSVLPRTGAGQPVVYIDDAKARNYCFKRISQLHGSEHQHGDHFEELLGGWPSTSRASSSESTYPPANSGHDMQLSRVRALFYMLQRATETVRATHYSLGVCILINVLSDPNIEEDGSLKNSVINLDENSFNHELIDRLFYFVDRIFPILVRSLHFVVQTSEKDQGQYTLLLKAAEDFTKGTIYQDFAKFHFGRTRADIASELKKHRFHRKGLPSSLGGCWTESKFRGWMRRQLHLEEGSILSDDQKVDRRRALNALHSRQKRKRRKIEYEVLSEQHQFLSKRNDELREGQEKLEHLLERAKEEVEKFCAETSIISDPYYGGFNFSEAMPIGKEYAMGEDQGAGNVLVDMDKVPFSFDTGRRDRPYWDQKRPASIFQQERQHAPRFEESAMLFRTPRKTDHRNLFHNTDFHNNATINPNTDAFLIKRNASAALQGELPTRVWPPARSPKNFMSSSYASVDIPTHGGGWSFEQGGHADHSINEGCRDEGDTNVLYARRRYVQELQQTATNQSSLDSPFAVNHLFGANADVNMHSARFNLNQHAIDESLFSPGNSLHEYNNMMGGDSILPHQFSRERREQAAVANAFSGMRRIPDVEAKELLVDTSWQDMVTHPHFQGHPGRRRINEGTIIDHTYRDLDYPNASELLLRRNPLDQRHFLRSPRNHGITSEDHAAASMLRSTVTKEDHRMANPSQQKLESRSQVSQQATANMSDWVKHQMQRRPPYY